MTALTPAVILAIGNLFIPALIFLVIIYYIVRYTLLLSYRMKNRDNLLQSRSEMPFAKFIKWGDLISGVIGLLAVIYFIRKFYL